MLCSGSRRGRIDVLVATDIVQRGIDIEDISMVVNYDVPRCAEDYVHRVGRTARANAGGMAVTLVSDRDGVKFRQIERFLKKEIRKDPLPETVGKASDKPQAPCRRGGWQHRGKGGKQGNAPKNTRNAGKAAGALRNHRKGDALPARAPTRGRRVRNEC